MQPASFVVRIWADDSARLGEPVWRFHARHVQSGEETYGCTLLDLKWFVERLAAIPGPPIASDPARPDRGIRPDES